MADTIVWLKESEILRERNAKLKAACKAAESLVKRVQWLAYSESPLEKEAILVLAQLRDAVNDSLLPLSPPKPKVRPYTPVEAAAHLGRKFVMDSKIFKLESVESDGFWCYSSETDDQRNLHYEQLAECTWADTGEPCGVVEP